MDPSASDIHREQLRQLQATCPRAEVIEILAGAVFALIAERRVSSFHIAPQQPEVIP